ncbi:MAG: tRNA (cytidine(34)-2'-O)-methyltransferase [Desulfovibrionales bacterium]
MEIVLYQPQIPPNTGSIARLCAATATPLHLIYPLGFSLEDRYLKRAGLDYWPHVDLKVWPSWEDFLEKRTEKQRLVFSSARKGCGLHRFRFSLQDMIVLGPETMGLPQSILDRAEHLVRIPIWGEVRSLNLANAASILLYEGFRQTGVLDAKE